MKNKGYIITILLVALTAFMACGKTDTTTNKKDADEVSGAAVSNNNSSEKESKDTEEKESEIIEDESEVEIEWEDYKDIYSSADAYSDKIEYELFATYVVVGSDQYFDIDNIPDYANSREAEVHIAWKITNISNEDLYVGPVTLNDHDNSATHNLHDLGYSLSFILAGESVVVDTTYYVTETDISEYSSYEEFRKDYATSDEMSYLYIQKLDELQSIKFDLYFRFLYNVEDDEYLSSEKYFPSDSVETGIDIYDGDNKGYYNYTVTNNDDKDVQVFKTAVQYDKYGNIIEITYFDKYVVSGRKGVVGSLPILLDSRYDSCEFFDSSAMEYVTEEEMNW
jgi:hypothetical protein